MVGMGLIPILTRLFEPEHFGILAVFFSITTLISVISTGAYDRSLVIPGENKVAANLLGLGSTLALAVALVALIALPPFRHTIARVTQTPEMTFWVVLIPLAILLGALSRMLRAWNLRHKAFIVISAAELITSLSGGLTKIFFGVSFGGSAWALIVGTMLGTVATLCCYIYGIRRYPEMRLGGISLAGMRRAGAEYRRFPIYLAPTDLLNAVAQNGTSLLLAALYSTKVLGFYMLAVRMMERPVRFVSKAVQEAYLQKAAEQVAKQTDPWGGFVRATFGLAALGIVPFSLVALLGEDLFVLVLGDDWAFSGQLARYLAPWLFLLFVNRPTTGVLTVLQKLRFQFFYNLTLAFLRLVAIFSGWLWWDSILVSVALFAAVGVAFNLGYISYGAYVARHAVRRIPAD